MLVPILHEKVGRCNMIGTLVVQVKIVTLYRHRRSSDNMLSGVESSLGGVRHVVDNGTPELVPTM